MPALFEVTFNYVWDKHRDPYCGGAETSETVAADDAEQAIKKVRASNVGDKVPRCDDDGNEIKGKFATLTDIVVYGVSLIRTIDRL